MKYFFHVGPPFAGRAVVQRPLTRNANFPPFLRGWVGGHLGHVAGEIAAGVFKITEQVMPSVRQFAQVNLVVFDVARFDHFQNAGPDGGVKLFVFREFIVAKTDDGAVAFHNF
jgi:hypothetical protein